MEDKQEIISYPYSDRESCDKRIANFDRKRTTFIIWSIILLPILVFLAFVVFAKISETTYVNVNFADNVTIEYVSHIEEESFIAEVTAEEKELLKKIFSGFFTENMSGKCGRGNLSITFSSVDKTLIIYPVEDSCNNFTVVQNERERHIRINYEDFSEVQEMRRRYGVIWNWEST